MTVQPRNALVTGAARRIGRAISLALADAGYGVCIHHRSSEAEAEDLAAEITAAGGRAAVVRADLAEESETAGLVAQASEALGPLDVLVNNASLFERDGAETATRESWDRHMEVNLRAPFVLTQAFAAALPADAAGNVVNILDQRVWNLTPHFVSYTLSKSGLWTLTRTLALALAPRIRVNGVAPGPVLPSPRQSEEGFRRQAEATPLGRAVAPEEIARGVVFVLGAEAMTGQMIALDSGQHLQWAPAAAGGAPEE
ncbi:MAG: SDR family oxidoreductase [Alphaproteobacteria bacterium]|nr:SDR family oxidoreductase [Alphaproteobacteria bacterium]